MPKIKVGEKALAHLSRGLYRSPASALRELVSNGWDANASRVDINLNYPNFALVSITDDGDGFQKEEFIRLMKGIGNSSKRPINKPLINGRPTIGRLGIGLLGIAQICGSFKIISRPRGGEPFHATVRLFDLLRERLDENDPSLIKATEVEVGEYDFEAPDSSMSGYGTRIIATDVHPTFMRSFQQSLKFEKYVPPSRHWEKIISTASSVHSLNELGDYWRLLWELAASCPVPYINGKALPDGLIVEKQRELEKYKFSLFVDGIAIRKPVFLEGNPGGYTSRKIELTDKKVFGVDLALDGYICVQEGEQLKPDELRGIMIRIANVGIGYYDQTFLDYRYNQGPRSRWVTGEIYVSNGLQAALNIDRDSFNKFHPEYRCIQELVHKVLKEEIFPEVYRKIKKRSGDKAKKRHAARRAALDETITEAGEKGSNSSDGAKTAPDELDTKKANRELAAAILELFEIANRANSGEKRQRIFTELLLNLLRKW